MSRFEACSNCPNGMRRAKEVAGSSMSILLRLRIERTLVVPSDCLRLIEAGTESARIVGGTTATNNKLSRSRSLCECFSEAVLCTRVTRLRIKGKPGNFCSTSVKLSVQQTKQIQTCSISGGLQKGRSCEKVRVSCLSDAASHDLDKPCQTLQHKSQSQQVALFRSTNKQYAESV